MEWVLLPLFAAGVSLLTLFSGFGLGTLLLPAFALFFPLEVAVAMTAIVHLAGNLFKTGLLGRQADWRIVGKFGLPAIIGAWLGAHVLQLLAGCAPLASYELAGKVHGITALKLVIALLMIVFALWEAIPPLASLTFRSAWLLPGGLLSGFFGGLSGHQGALRAAFLSRLGLTKEAFVGTGVVIACLVDFTRLAGYSRHLLQSEIINSWQLLALTMLAAFAGSWLGTRLLRKITRQTIQRTVAAMLLLIAILLGSGLV
ncbi:MAG: sulfite exporter TauE/SafE family protein [Lacunisphaera sp.]|nr:sulfite exporter TauE/SafE family protein [Lacunisphaera sp.]